MRRENSRCGCGHVYGDHFPGPKCEHALGCDCEGFREPSDIELLAQADTVLVTNQSNPDWDGVYHDGRKLTPDEIAERTTDE